MIDGSPLPAFLAVYYNSLTPQTDNPESEINFQLKLIKNVLNEGEGTQLSVQIQNRVTTPHGMIVAVIGFPGGAAPRFDQLRELVTAGQISYFEIVDREVILYWRQLNARGKDGDIISLMLDVTGQFPGSYTGSASRCYIYYNEVNKFWLPGLELKILPVS